jgi:hypothetical protein
VPTPKRLPRSCQQRHHSYPSDEPGAECTGCGKKRGTREARALGAGGVLGLRAALGISELPSPEGHEQQQPTPAPAVVASPPAPAEASPPAELVPTRPKPSTVLWPRVARRGTQLFEAVVEWSLEKRGRRANEPEPEDRAEFEAALGEQLGIWFPDVAAGPMTRLVMAGGFIAAEMSWNAEKLPPKAPEAKQTPAAQTPPPAPPAEGHPNNGASTAHVAVTEAEAAILRLL